MGIATPPTVHFKIPDVDEEGVDEEINDAKPEFKPVKFATLDEVNDAKAAFAPGAARKIATEAAEMAVPSN